MKASIRTMMFAVVAGVLVGAGGHTDPQLRTVVGMVEIGSGDPPAWREAHSGDLLQPGEALRTGAGGRAELETSAGTIRVYERSTLRIPAGSDGSSQLELDRGASIFDVRHRRPGEPFEVRTPHAVVMVKGTRFTVSDSEDGASVSVDRGLVAVRDPGSPEHELLVHPGFGVSGGAGRSFALGLMQPNDDAWESWSLGAEPPRPSVPSRESGAGARSARSAARAEASRELVALGANRESLAESAGRARGEDSPASALKGDDVVDKHDGVELKQRAGEALLGGTASSSFDIQVQTSGGPNQVHIVGSGGLDVTLSEKQLEQVLSGNTSVLGSQLLGVLNTRGVSPSVFANQMLDLL